MRKKPGCFAAVALAACLVLAAPAGAQRNLAGAAETKLALDRLNVLGRVMMIAAHPDDENTALLAWLSRGRHAGTAYLSLTRGEGGQNLIGPEQGDLLGLIRTQELLQARRIDGAQQLFTRAIDFGFSKSAEETLAKWGKETVLGDIVWNIRQFRPDVVVLIFSGTPRDGHGHHHASALLGREAFLAAGDKARFPEQLRWTEPWQPTRLLWNVYYWALQRELQSGESKDWLKVSTGEFDPLLGYSYAELAGMSRSMHRSQGFGSAERRGEQYNYLAHVAGDPAKQDIFDGIDASWSRIPGGEETGKLLSEAARSFQPEHPERTAPLLLQARPLVAALKDPLAAQKLKDLDEAVALCTGLWLDASADRYNAVPGTKFRIQLEALNRSNFPLSLEGIRLEGFQNVSVTGAWPAELKYNEVKRVTWTAEVPPAQPYSEPYWLAAPKQGSVYRVDQQTLAGLPETPPVLSARFRLRAGGQTIELVRPVAHRYVDRVRGEEVRPLEIVPVVAVKISAPVAVFPDQRPKGMEVALLGNTEKTSGNVRLSLPEGWKSEPASRPFTVSGAGEQAVVSFEVTPPEASAKGDVRAVASVNGRDIGSGMQVISYPHITPQTVFPGARAEVVRADIGILAKEIGYVMGAGDEVPEALRQMGCDVKLLSAEELVNGDLSRFDAIVTGVRAFNTRADLRANFQRLLDYAEGGGTLVVQYNVLPLVNGKIGPYPITVGRGRVSVEEAPVTFPNPAHPLLQAPNRITKADFDGWIQERGLYFASEWDPRYQPLFSSNDPGEKPLAGGTLVARHGKGAYVFTAYSWFRELPAGVPGAYRIFANLLSAGKVLP